MKDVRSAILAYLRQVVSESGSNANVTIDTLLIEGDLLDSISLARVIMFIDEQFGVGISDEDVGPELFQTPATLATYVEDQLALTS
jgi:acyl carrier protein